MLLLLLKLIQRKILILYELQKTIIAPFAMISTTSMVKFLDPCLNVNVCYHDILLQKEKEVIVDVSCGMSVMRGADVFVQGILGAPTSKYKNIHCLGAVEFLNG